MQPQKVLAISKLIIEKHKMANKFPCQLGIFCPHKAHLFSYEFPKSQYVDPTFPQAEPDCHLFM